MADKFELKALITVVDKLTPTFKKINRAVGGQMKAVSGVVGSVGGLGEATRTALAPLAALAGAAGVGSVAALGAAVIGTSAKFEKFTAILETIEGSAEKAKQSMEWVSDFATKTPYELDEVTDAFVRLKSYGIDPQSGALKAAGDAAAAMGKPLGQAVEALADALTGENERLKEMGVRTSKVGDKIYYKWVENGKDIYAVAKANSAAQIQAVVTGIWNRRYQGAMDRLSDAWDGTVSNLKDSYSRFMLQIGKAGVFDFLKGKLKGVLATMNRLQADGTLDRWAKKISDGMIDLAHAVGDLFSGISLDDVIAGFRSFFTAIGDAIRAVGGLKNALLIVMALFAAPFVAAVLGVAASLVSFAGAAFSLGKTLLSLLPILNMLRTAAMAMMIFAAANPVLLAVVAAVVLLAGAAYLLWRHWDKVSAFFADFFPNLWRLAGYAIGYLVGLFAKFGPQVWAAVTGAFGALAKWLGAALAALGPMALAALAGLVDVFVRIWDSPQQALQAFLDWSFGKLGAWVDRIKGVFDTVKGWLGQFGEGFKVGFDDATRPADDKGSAPNLVQSAPGRGSPLLQAGKAQVSGQVDVRFSNTPPGTRVSAPQSRGGVAINPDVGYSSMVLGG
ncbi:tape measure protein [Jeongeupia sp. USM3]|uniref:tape measure protein n=1 Tax=Jeongeupia sp. USM3 TaxID=1906741 RepID=UPI00089DEF0C|nr:tape measure protein [Jeongeupia sp. USM3]AOY00098.1 hypothetical protein BJP62_06320 [Jeongeupia sp. USM3]